MERHPTGWECCCSCSPSLAVFALRFPRSGLLLQATTPREKSMFITFPDLAGFSFCGIIITGLAVIVGIETGLLPAALLILFITSVICGRSQ